MIGDDVRITIVRISSKSIRIGIEAPESKSVIRDEILSSEKVAVGSNLHTQSLGGQLEIPLR